MARDPEDTKRRIFEAATAEFAEHGIAGARIDRIAAAARANKQLIYAYFGNKRQLFELIAASNVAQFVEEVEFDPHDLPRYAAQAFDFYVRHPAIAKIGAWHSLEPGENEHRVDAIEEIIRTRTTALAQAQADGRVDATIPSADLIAMMNALATSWSLAFPERIANDTKTHGEHRAAVVEAVARITGQPVSRES